MAQPYSDDLRCRILKAYEQGRASLSKLAEQFQVSLPYIKKIRGQQLRTGRMERAPERPHGPPRRITPEIAAQLREWVRGTPDLTLSELQQKMGQSCRVHMSLKPIWQSLREMGLRLKKNHSMPRSRRRLKRGSVGRPGGSRSRR
jgi:transposase